MFAVAVGTAALIIVLSVFNGLEDLIRSLHNYFDPDLKITATVGKSFERSDELMKKINSIEGIGLVTEVVEDNAYMNYKQASIVVNVKGVQPGYFEKHNLQDKIVIGEIKYKDSLFNYTIIGRGVQSKIGLNNLNDPYAIRLYYPNRYETNTSNLNNLVNIGSLKAVGVFEIERQYDVSYIFVPLDFALNLFGYENRRTAIEVMVNEDYSTNEVQRKLQSVLGKDFKVLDKDQQHTSLLKAIKIEKLFVRLILSFIIAVASFNIFFSLTMLSIDKKRDLAILRSLGATPRLLKKIFFYEGAIISFTGAITGLVLGFIICFVQQKFGLVSMGMESSVMDSYPVKMHFEDFIFTSISIIIITLLASYRPAKIAAAIKTTDINTI